MPHPSTLSPLLNLLLTLSLASGLPAQSLWRPTHPLLSPAAADLAVSAASDPNPVGVFMPLTYAFTITNHGPDASPMVTSVITLPAGVRVASLPVDCAGQNIITCTTMALNPTAQAIYTLALTPTMVGLFTTTVAVTTESDANPANNFSAPLIQVQGPSLSLTPTALSVTQQAGTTTTQTLTLTNNGLGLLTWRLGEHGLEQAPVAPIPSAVLYNNGPIVNQPGAGAGGADASVVQNLALGMTVQGANHGALVNYRVTDQFTVPAGAGWYLENILFYAYQTGSGTNSPITAINYRIWDGRPDLPNSAVVYGDTFTNRLITTTWANIYRVSQTSLTNVQRPVMRSSAQAGVFLPPGTYWLDWQSDGILIAGPWVPFITINGQATTGDAYQWISDLGRWVPLTDTGTSTHQGLPFVLTGKTCAQNLLWVNANLTSGNTPYGQQSTLTLSFDSTGLQVGQTYTATVCVLSNDAAQPVVDVPVSLTIVPTFGVALAPSVAAQSADPGAAVTYTLQLANTGNATDAYTLSLAHATWPTTLSPTVIGPLGAGASVAVAVQVTVPTTASASLSDLALVTATSQGDGAQVATATLTTTANAIYGLSLAPPAQAQTAYVGETLTYTLALTNTGNGFDSFNLSVSGSVWPTTLTPTTLGPLAAGASALVNLTLTIPLTATHNQTNILTVTAASQGNGSVSTSSVLTTTAGLYQRYLPFIKK